MSSLTCEHSCLDDLGGSRLEIPMHTQFLCGRLGHSINVGVRRIKKESDNDQGKLTKDTRKFGWL